MIRIVFSPFLLTRENLLTGNLENYIEATK